jgi:hypothetical protein
MARSGEISLAVRAREWGASRPFDRDDSGLPKWPNRKDFVSHFRESVSPSGENTLVDVKELFRKLDIIGFSLRRETAGIQPALEVRGALVIR